MQNLPVQNYPTNNPTSPNFLYPDDPPYPSNPLNQAYDGISFIQDPSQYAIPNSFLDHSSPGPSTLGKRPTRSSSRSGTVDVVCAKQDKQHVNRLNYEHLVLHYQRLFTILLRHFCPKPEFIRVTRIPPGPDAHHHSLYFEEICDIIYLSAVFKLWRDPDHRRSSVPLSLFARSIRHAITDLCFDYTGRGPTPDQLDFGDSVFIVQQMPVYLSNRNCLEHVGACNQTVDKLCKKYNLSEDVLYHKMYNTVKKTLF